MKPLAIVSGDWHIHDWKTFNEDNRRTKSQLTALYNMGYTASQDNIPIIFTGDFGHAFGKVSLELWIALTIFFNNWEAKEFPPIIGISGNHDQEKANYDEDEASPDLWTLLCLLFPKVCVNLNWRAGVSSVGGTYLNLMGIPYTTYNKSFDIWVKAFQKQIRSDAFNILVIHTDLYGAMDNGREVGTVENIPKDMDEYFKGFDLVVSGHIHLPQKLGRKIYMVGAMLQQRRSDMDGEFGFWTMGEHKGKLKMEFTHLDMLPKFVYLKPDQMPPDRDNYYISAESLSDEEVEEVEMGFSSKSSKGELVRNYMKAIGDKSVSKRIALTKLLNSAIDD